MASFKYCAGPKIHGIPNDEHLGVILATRERLRREQQGSFTVEDIPALRRLAGIVRASGEVA